LRGKVLDRRDVLDAGVVDKDVNAAERGPGPGDEVGDLRRLGHVGAIVFDLDATLLRQVDALRFYRRLVAEAIQHDVAPLPGKCLGNGLSDTARRSGDEDGFTLERHTLP